LTLYTGGVVCPRDLPAPLTRWGATNLARPGAGPRGPAHDAVVLSSLTPVAMLFVRCREGLSHHPGEHVHPRDLGVALDIIVDFLGRLAATSR
jgi:allantoate deiminase